MPERTEYSNGTPSWIDLGTTDVGAARDFYSELFGWSYTEEPIDESSSYVMAAIDEKPVAGMMQYGPDDPRPPMWSSYVSVDDLEATVGKVEPAGGSVMLPPMDVMEAGRMAVITDPTGGVICLWQKKQHPGAALVNEHGTLTWNELITSDPDRAAAFYGDVLGWEAEIAPGDGPPYTMFKVGERPVAGAMAPPMDGMPTFWGVYFAVDDTDASVARAVELGATVVAGPMDLPDVGRMAAMTDPQGAFFEVIRFDLPPE